MTDQDAWIASLAGKLVEEGKQLCFHITSYGYVSFTESDFLQFIRQDDEATKRDFAAFLGHKFTDDFIENLTVTEMAMFLADHAMIRDTEPS